MSAVVKAVKKVVDFVEEKVIKPILDDPLSAIATAAAASMGIPFLGLQAGAVAAGVANTAAGLVQGEKFDEAVKGGLMTGATIGAVNFVGDKIAGAGSSSSNIASVADDVAAVQKSGMNTSSSYTNPTGAATSTFDVTKNLSGSLDDIVASSSSPSLSSQLNAPSWSAQNAATGLGDDLLTTGGTDLSSISAKTGLGDDLVGGMQKTNYAGKNLGQYADETVNPVVESQGSVFKPTHESSYTGTYRSPTSPNYDVAKNLSGSADDWAVTGPGLKNPYAKPVDVFSQNVDEAITAGANKPYNIVDAAKSELGRYYDAAMGYVDDAFNFAKNNPILTLGGTALVYDTLQNLNKDDEGGDDNNDTDIDERKDEAEEKFDKPLEQLEYKRDAREYKADPRRYKELEDFYNYGAGPEHEFFTPAVYTPITYAQGGEVPQQPSPINPAFAFYKYGNVPQSVRRYGNGGYASGGNPRHGQSDGRSDDIQALLSPGEFVVDAETVSLLGNGSSDAGARRLEEMRSAVRKQKGGALSKGKFSPNAKSPLSYMKRKG